MAAIRTGRVWHARKYLTCNLSQNGYDVCQLRIGIGDLVTRRTATCRCGQLRVDCEGDPVRVSVCHCLECQKRSGSVFATQARWPDANVTMSGRHTIWERIADSGHQVTYRFCPTCGSTLTYVIEDWPGVTAVPVGAFSDPDFPSPRFSVYENRKHAWVEIRADEVEHSSTPSTIRKPGDKR